MEEIWTIEFDSVLEPTHTTKLRQFEELLSERARGTYLYDPQWAFFYKIVQKYKAALKLAGDANKGLEVFRKNCVACHRHGGEGYAIGPDVATVKNRDYESALIQILDPNREILANFEQYFVTLKNGQTVSGRIVRESASGLTLGRAGGVESEILRKNIKSIISSGRSLMPEGLEAVIDLQSMSDLWAFLKS